METTSIRMQILPDGTIKVLDKDAGVEIVVLDYRRDSIHPVTMRWSAEDQIGPQGDY